MVKVTIATALFVFATCLSVPAASLEPPQVLPVANPLLTGSMFYRTELYFGRDKPDNSVVSGDEWKDFLEREVTSRFPAGFTVLDGSGQYRDKSGKIIREPSKVLVFLYSKADRRSASEKINEIRVAYCKQFQQESVLRLDFRKPVEVSFEE